MWYNINNLIRIVIPNTYFHNYLIYTTNMVFLLQSICYFLYAHQTSGALYVNNFHILSKSKALPLYRQRPNDLLWNDKNSNGVVFILLLFLTPLNIFSHNQINK